MGYDREWYLAHFGRKGQDFRPNLVSLGGFQTPPTKMSCTTPPHIPKYGILQKEKNYCELSLNIVSVGDSLVVVIETKGRSGES